MSEPVKEEILRLTKAMDAVLFEAKGAILKYPPMHSAHEGMSVLKEEVDELWDEVKIKQGKRDPAKLRKEAVQVAAMALRFLVDICNGNEQR